MVAKIVILSSAVKDYDESLNFLRTALDRAKLGGVSAGSGSDRVSGKEKLGRLSPPRSFCSRSRNPTGARVDFTRSSPTNAISPSLDGRSVFDDKPARSPGSARSFDCGETLGKRFLSILNQSRRDGMFIDREAMAILLAP